MRFATNCETLIGDNWALEVVTQGYALEFLNLPAFSGVRETGVFGQKGDILPQEVEDLLEKDAIAPVPPHQESLGFYCTFFVVPKKETGKLRPILNLKPPNQFLAKKNFKMETLKTVCRWAIA